MYSSAVSLYGVPLRHCQVPAGNPQRLIDVIRLSIRRFIMQHVKRYDDDSRKQTRRIEISDPADPKKAKLTNVSQLRPCAPTEPPVQSQAGYR